MALLAIQPTTNGLNPNWALCAIAGDVYKNTGKETIHLRNEGPNPLTVYVTAQNECNQQFLHTVAYVVPAQVGTIPTVVLLGPEAFQFYNDTSGHADLSYSGTAQTPPGAPDLALVYSGSLSNLGIGLYRYMVTNVNGSGETTGGTEVAITTLSGFQAVTLNGIPLGPAGTTKRGIYRTLRNGASSAEQLVRYLNDNTTTSFTDVLADALLGVAVPTVNTAGIAAPGAPAVAAGAAGNPNGTYPCAVTFVNAAGETSGGVAATVTVTGSQINWSSIPIGPAGTTARKLYRSVRAASDGDAAALGESATVASGGSAGDAAALGESAIVTGTGGGSGSSSDNGTATGKVSPIVTSAPTSQDSGSPTATIAEAFLAHLVTTINDNTTTTFSDNLTDAALASAPTIPLVSAANVLQIAVTAA